MNYLSLYLDERKCKWGPSDVREIEYFVPFYMRKIPKYQASNVHFLSLYHLNEKLSNALESELGDIYAQRALVFQECRLYKEALNNMDLAEIHNYKEGFKDRRESCYSALKFNQQKQQFGDNPDYFQLTYRRHKSIPFIISGLRLKYDKDDGYYIITTRTLNTGDVIALENPLFATLAHNYRNNPRIETGGIYQRCSHCFKHNNMDLFPCKNCDKAFYCSTKCESIALDQYHRYECIINNSMAYCYSFVHKLRSFFFALYLYYDDIERMQQAYEERGFGFRSVYDIDFNGNPLWRVYRALMHSFHNSDSPKTCRYTYKFKDIFNCHPDLIRLWRGNESFIVAFLIAHGNHMREHGQAILDYPTNTTHFNGQLHKIRRRLTRKVIGVGYYPFAQLLRHSQNNNVIRHINKHNKLVMIVCRPIAKNEILYDDYK